MKWTATIKKIGSEALTTEDNMIILFGENVATELFDVSVIQKFSTATPSEDFIFQKGDKITIDNQTYVADYVGTMVENNMRTLEQVTLCFDKKSDDNPLANAIHFTFANNQSMPKFKVNESIEYVHI